MGRDRNIYMGKERHVMEKDQHEEDGKINTLKDQHGERLIETS